MGIGRRFEFWRLKTLTELFFIYLFLLETILHLMDTTISKWRRQHYSKFCLFLIKLPFNSQGVPSSRYLTHGSIQAIHFHTLSTHAICVTRVHVIGDFCHITCRLTAPDTQCFEKRANSGCLGIRRNSTW